MVRPLLVLLALLPSAVAQAHVGLGAQDGLAHGFVHPLTGLDHVLAMVAVGVLAARLGGRALYLVPLAFVVMMAAGGVLGMAGFALPVAELGIGMSVVVLGLVVALGLDLPATAAMALVGIFAICHGHAHGAEMPDTASGLAYGVGFTAATALLHAAGIGAGLLIGRAGPKGGPRVARLAGAATALAGIAILGSRL